MQKNTLKFWQTLHTVYLLLTYDRTELFRYKIRQNVCFCGNLHNFIQFKARGIIRCFHMLGKYHCLPTMWMQNDKEKSAVSSSPQGVAAYSRHVGSWRPQKLLFMSNPCCFFRNFNYYFVCLLYIKSHRVSLRDALSGGKTVVSKIFQSSEKLKHKLQVSTADTKEPLVPEAPDRWRFSPTILALLSELLQGQRGFSALTSFSSSDLHLLLNSYLIYLQAITRTS